MMGSMTERIVENVPNCIKQVKDGAWIIRGPDVAVSRDFESMQTDQVAAPQPTTQVCGGRQWVWERCTCSVPAVENPELIRYDAQSVKADPGYRDCERCGRVYTHGVYTSPQGEETPWPPLPRKNLDGWILHDNGHGGACLSTAEDVEKGQPMAYIAKQISRPQAEWKKRHGDARWIFTVGRATDCAVMCAQYTPEPSAHLLDMALTRKQHETLVGGDHYTVQANNMKHINVDSIFIETIRAIPANERGYYFYGGGNATNWAFGRNSRGLELPKVDVENPVVLVAMKGGIPPTGAQGQWGDLDTDFVCVPRSELDAHLRSLESAHNASYFAWRYGIHDRLKDYELDDPARGNKMVPACQLHWAECTTDDEDDMRVGNCSRAQMAALPPKVRTFLRDHWPNKQLHRTRDGKRKPAPGSWRSRDAVSTVTPKLGRSATTTKAKSAAQHTQVRKVRAGKHRQCHMEAEEEPVRNCSIFAQMGVSTSEEPVLQAFSSPKERRVKRGSGTKYDWTLFEDGEVDSTSKRTLEELVDSMCVDTIEAANTLTHVLTTYYHYERNRSRSSRLKLAQKGRFMSVLSSALCHIFAQLKQTETPENQFVVFNEHNDKWMHLSGLVTKVCAYDAYTVPVDVVFEYFVAAV
jgi:hypothetical protein